jgi:hypothetical protein
LHAASEPVPPKPPAPPPTPEPTPEPKPMEPKRLPQGIHAIVVALYTRHKELARGTDDQRRVLQKMICETVRAHYGPTYGWKSNHGIDIANSTDALAELPAGVVFKRNERQEIHVWDLFDGTSREPFPPHMSEVVHQFFVPVEPIDHLSGTTPEKPKPNEPSPPDDHDVPPTSPDVIADILRRLAALEGPRKVAIRTHDGKHVLCAEGAGGGDINATRTGVGPWETFTIEPVK